MPKKYAYQWIDDLCAYGQQDHIRMKVVPLIEKMAEERWEPCLMCGSRILFRRVIEADGMKSFEEQKT